VTPDNRWRGQRSHSELRKEVIAWPVEFCRDGSDQRDPIAVRAAFALVAVVRDDKGQAIRVDLDVRLATGENLYFLL
jgi:hypothetical protein